jgi:hypothetical protein
MGTWSSRGFDVVALEPTPAPKPPSDDDDDDSGTADARRRRRRRRATPARTAPREGPRRGGAGARDVARATGATAAAVMTRALVARERGARGDE